jgi:4-hydroxybutyryl-CoA dehydratase/vinylacetyl-CoA-Delta-isomerase
MKHNIYQFGELIEDVTTHPATQWVVENHARAFDASHDPQYSTDFTTAFTFKNGERIIGGIP